MLKIDSPTMDLILTTEEILINNFFLDCMNVEDIQGLNDQEFDTIWSSVLRGRRIRFSEGKLQSMLQEVQLDYQRVICGLAWENALSCQLGLFCKWNVSNSNENCVDQRLIKFQKVRNYLNWHTLYVLPEVYDAVQHIAESCQQVSNLCLFATSHSQSLAIEVFESHQIQATFSVVKYIKEEWTEKVLKLVKMYLRDIGKGAFDLKQSIPHVYDVIKIRRFINLITIMMEEALKNLVMNSVEKYTDMLQGTQDSRFNVNQNFPSDDHHLGDPMGCSFSNAIFYIELTMTETGAAYATKLSDFKRIINERMDEALIHCHEVKPPYVSLFPELIFPPETYLSSTGLLDDKIQYFRNQLMSVYESALIPLTTYANTFDKYLEFHLMDVNEYMQMIKKADYTVTAFKEEILFQQASVEDLEKNIAENVQIGPFNVDVAKTKNLLLNKRKDLFTKLLTLLTEKLRTEVDDVMYEYSEIRRKLREDPKCIEEVFETREYIENLPLQLSSLIDIATRLKFDYDVLEYFKWNISDEDFHNKWQALAFSSVINNQIVETNDYLLECIEKFTKAEADDEAVLSEKIILVTQNIIELGRRTDYNLVDEIAMDTKRIWKALKACQEQSVLCNERRRLLGMSPTDFNAQINDLEQQLNPYRALWVTVSDWCMQHDMWMENPLISIDADRIDDVVAEMQKTMMKSKKFFQDKNPKLEAIASDTYSKIESAKPYLGLIKSLKNPGMTAKHFDEINSLTGIRISLSPPTNLKGLLALDIMGFKDSIAEVADKASQEYAIVSTLNKMINEWEFIKIDMIPYKDTGTSIIKVQDEILIMLDEHIMNTQQIGYGPHRAAFEENINQWEEKLKLIQQVLLQWIKVQKAWMYLEPIFTAEDISKQLPVESKKYNSMERTWRAIIKAAAETPLITKVCADRALLGSLKECENLLEIVQRGLADYLQTKRVIFPRFYFLSDEELLEILAQTKNVTAVQPHLNKCFENMKKLKFEDDLQITRMYSADGEEVILKSPLYPVGNVEDWLKQVELAMQNTLRQVIQESLDNIAVEKYEDWIAYMWPGQVVICVSQIYWTAHVENSIRLNSIREFYSTMLSELETLRCIVRSNPSHVQRLIVESLIIIQVHGRDVVAGLIEKNVSDVSNFSWNSQMRYYWIDSGVEIRVVNAQFPYGYEYLGNNGRLVITPLTERCYLTLTGALHLKFGGAPSGPAGTGKTETTKDLAKAFAIQCVVFNCSDQLDYVSMGKFFKGLASAGAWACFDEFNRIDIEVLSVIAQQILTIQQAQQMRLLSFLFEGCEISLKPMCAVFITMNPGYAGRTELPDNLKALFRPVAMMVPNYSLIAEISLFSYGFSQAKNLAVKITTTFKLSSEQLSSQDHYDFGMRAVKTVIAYAGNLKRLPGEELNESQICLRALRDVNVPKFFRKDLILFEGILGDLFPGLEALESVHDVLDSGIRETIRIMGLREVEEQILKVIQLFETTTVRHGLMLVGPTGTGKTKCHEILKTTCNMLHGQSEKTGHIFEAVEASILNPKAITLGQLYGEFDLNTHEWTDGLLPFLVRSGVNATDHRCRWYIFDGPVDAVWIENMNTVLDDNKKLCLTSGEIIKLSPKQTIMFEVGDLRVASPATVSRCGMVYLEAGTVGYEALIQSWITLLPHQAQDYSTTLLNATNQWLLPGLEFLRKELCEVVPTVDSMIVQAYINLINMRFIISSQEIATSKINIRDLLNPWVIFAIVWSIGASCDWKGRSIFDAWLRELQERSSDALQFPTDGLVYDYTLHEGGYADTSMGSYIPPRWVRWNYEPISVSIGAQTQFHDIEIPTLDSIRIAMLIQYLIENKNNPLLIGPTGSGKTLTISQKLSRNMPVKYISDFITFSAKTSSRKIQDLIDSKLDKRRAGVYGPVLPKKQIFFIDDVNMPILEKYGAQPPLELMRQLLDSGGWYDSTEVGAFRQIVDVNIIGAMQPPGGGRNPICQRLLRHFHIIAFPEMQNEAKITIYGTILKSWLIRSPLSTNPLDTIINATINVYTRICREFLPSPDKCHYTYNLRDFSRIFQGMLMVEPKKIETRGELLCLWYHEVSRVMGDRLVNESDLARFYEILRMMFFEYFGVTTESAFITREGLVFCDFCSQHREYQRVLNHQEMRAALVQILQDYNDSSNSPMKLVLFPETMSHICRITRILRQPRGNALLLGVGGSGRQSLTRLSAFLSEYICFQIEFRRFYSIKEWQDDIRGVMMKAGLLKRPTVFLISDTQFKDDTYLEDIHNILNSGDVPNLYQRDELEKIYKDMRVKVQEDGLVPNKTNLFNAYLKNVRNNLHIVVAMSPIGDVFRARIRQFPALVNCCTIDWFHSWSHEALQSVAEQFIRQIEDDEIIDQTFESIVATCQFMHSSTIEASQEYLQVLNRHNYVTPVSYLEMLANYGKLLQTKKKGLALEMSRLSTGLDKLADTELEVKEMQITLTKMKPELEKAAIATSAMIERIRTETIEAEATRRIAEAQESEASELKRINEAIRNEANLDLAQVKPMLEAAEASLKALNKGDITEVKALKRPPEGVVLVIEAMCILYDIKPLKIPGKLPGEKILDYWTPGSQLLSDAGHFLRELENFDKSKITQEMINKLKYYIDNPSFHPRKVLQVSKACYSLCLWLHAMYNWYFVNLKVTPKMEALKNAELSLIDTENLLKEAMDKLHQVETSIMTLQQTLNIEEDKKKKLETEKQLCEERMSRAVRLITGLADEHKRWLISIGEIRVLYKNAVGDILLSSGAIAYLSPFTDTYRNRLFTAWKHSLVNHVPISDNCALVAILGNSVEIQQWHIDGLPRDILSIENVIISKNSNRWPLFIDPQRQANKWIKKTEKSNGLMIARMTNKDLIRTIENSVKFGRPCLIENVECEIDAAIDSILLRNIFHYGGQLSIKIGDNVIPYNNKFRLYLTTKLPNPHYPPEIAVKVALVNFTLTINGLLDQMLSLAVMHERPDLEAIRSQLIVSCASMKSDLKDIEDKILDKLSKSEGSTVDNIDLITTLEISKHKSEEIKRQVSIAETTQIDIDTTRSMYLPLANRAQILFFSISDLKLIDYMYQYSLEWYTNIFIESISNTDKCNDVVKRITLINEVLTRRVFSNVCRSLFEKHKLHLAFLICVRIGIDEKTINSEEWKHLLCGAVTPKQQFNPAIEWLPERPWQELLSLCSLKRFAISNFTTLFKNNLAEFKLIYDSQQPEKEKWVGLLANLDDFQKLLILKALRPDRLINGIQIFVKDRLGKYFIEFETIQLEILYRESQPRLPIVFILSSGTDPASDLYKLAESQHLDKKLYTISLGQGQGPRAELMLQQSIEIGNWVFLQNCHLAPSWMPKLESLIDPFPDKIHQDFRLFLTSSPTPDFPSSILENASKLTIEPPRGIKANMYRAFTTQVTQQHHTVIASTSSKATSFKALLYSLCLFHSILLERRKYGSLAFNIPYEFSDGDLAICISQLEMFTMESANIPFEVLIYTAGHINYGGRITDDWDRRCLLTLLEDFYNEKVLKDDYSYDTKGIYKQISTNSPRGCTYEDYLNNIKLLPLNDEPDIFGLNQNADISCATTEAYYCLNNLAVLQPKTTTSTSEASHNILEITATELLTQIPKIFDINIVQERHPVLYEESFNTVLQLETTRYNILLKVVRDSLQQLIGALKGQIIMNETLEIMANNLSLNKVPNIWHTRGYPSLKALGAWMSDLKERITFMANWNEKGIPPGFWISGFFFPQAFLTATLQNFARKNSLAIDTIDFSYKVLTSFPMKRPANGCIVYGLFLEGCRWHGEVLEESLPAVLYTEMKPILLLPEQYHKSPTTGIYNCPVYKTLTRSGTLSTTGHSTNFVLCMEIPTTRVQTHWIKRGVALICALD